jgi:hypothetical protein
MIPTTDTPPPGLGQNDQFTTTHWSVVLAARQTDSPAASAALEQLCQIYWYPLYAFVRRQAVVIGRVHALEGGGTKSGWQAANRGVGQDLDASV